MTKQVTLSENALQVAKSRYFIGDENWEKCTYRIADVVSSAEGGKKNVYREKFHEMLYDMDFICGGRILRNAGRTRGSMFNCYVLPIGDSIEEIGQFLKESLQLWSEGGGVGCNFSSLRPKGDPILGKGGHSSGLVSFLEASDYTAATIESGGSRRAAALACVDVSHPEVLDFIDAKLVDGRLSYYNISVAINNEFLEAVELDANWEFRFKHRSYGKVKARFIWDKILKNMIECAEPGLLNFTNLTKNNSWYYDPIVSTNPCGEVALEPHGICCLGSLVLRNFITGNVNTNWIKLENTIKLAVRFLDDIIDVNKYVLKENDVKAHNSRRVGLGVMALSEYLFAKQLRYGSEKTVTEVERTMKFVRDCVYQALVELAVEKGAFPKFNPVPYLKSSFVRKLPVNLRMDIKEKGVRCVTGMAVAPTGTVSLLADVTSGIEPLFSKAYHRKDRVSSRVYIHPLYKSFLENNGPIPNWFVDTDDLKPQDHLEVQSVVQKYVDGAVSKTINLSADTTVDNLSELLLEYIKDLKGVTVYVDESRDDQVVRRITKEEMPKYLKENNIDHSLSENDVKCSPKKCVT